MTSNEWRHKVLPYLDDEEMPLMCVVNAGEVLYLSARYMHATVNLEAFNTFVTIFPET